jgi:tRNA threonylcarbamoyladenosine biosynthesis protein TsaB
LSKVNFIAIDTAGKYLQIAYSLNGAEGYMRDDSPLKHSETLMPRIAELLGAERTRAADVFGVTTGPGSFTGIRIGVTTVKALAYADPRLNIAAFTTLAVRAENVGGGRVVSVADGGNRTYYAAVYSDGAELTPPQCFTPVRLKAFLEGIKEPAVVTGDIAGMDIPKKLKREFFDNDRIGLFRVTEKIIAAGSFISGADLSPLYIQLPQAEKDKNND